ncbi:hypothetical protein [Propionivibrio sp.]|uniref:hypothetical protein n=1 Tax=Propionivibrio sp. TaxID=2212460 RepID=UPI003BF1B6C6
MQELVNVRQISGEPKRRWFYSDDFDLIIWLHQDGSIAGFELCYNKKQAESSLVWRLAGGFTHMAVDDGEASSGKYKQTPILIPGGYFDAKQVHAAFAKECSSLPEEVATQVLQCIAQHPSYGAARVQE